jgi:polyisoprenoid-binding protein YceI
MIKSESACRDAQHSGELQMTAKKRNNAHLKILITLLFVAATTFSMAQSKYFTRNATISFFSSAPTEDIKAENFNATGVLDAESGAVEFSALMKSFNFKKALMQEHFNENYVESSVYPKAVFKGKIEDMSGVNLKKDGEYPVTVSGDMTMHGVTQQVTTDGFLTVKDGKVGVSTEFIMKPADYDIEIPSVVRENIAKEIEVSVDAKLKPLNR